ncbi:MAG: DNA mismatch repair protein MutS [Polyangiaceae bacterium]|nr:DNA mismatch repair protein MutS [Polyangiaceae bacterium]
MGARKTPVMQQHAAAKASYPDALLFFRLGDFYEMFGDDAVECSRLLDLTLTSRNKGKADEIPMAGVPHHAAHNYIGRLLQMGRQVAVCEQMADPATVKGIVPREVVRVLTPGTVTSGDHLESDSNNWLAAVERDADGAVALCFLDLSTGELAVASLPDVVAALGELGRAAPKEILVGATTPEESEAMVAAIGAVGAGVSLTTPVRPDEPLDEAEVPGLCGAFASEAKSIHANVPRALARALRYARRCNPKTELPITRLQRWDPTDALVIDQTAIRHLELVASLSGHKEATLLRVVDHTKTAFGARLLRRRLLAPLTDVGTIRRRLDAVELFVMQASLRRELRARLTDVRDIERLSVRADLREANPRDLGSLRDSLLAAQEAVDGLNELREPDAREQLGLSGPGVDAVPELAKILGDALVDRPPAAAKEGAIFRKEFDAELHEYDELRKSGTERVVELEARLKKETGIGNLRAKHTRVFGWYVEVSRVHLEKVPDAWRRKQTVANGERYTLDELDELAERIVQADGQHRTRELALLEELYGQVREAGTRIRSLATLLASWDVSSALAELAHSHDYCRPELSDSSVLHIEDGRHAVVERLAAAGRFVPNDVVLDADAERMWLVTGPNMAGKSTLLRQTALTVILAQMGSYVPARRAAVGIVDRVLSRVGASDNLAAGESTFMVEMRETAEILRSATARSLVILDEIGRGTSTFDGLAIARAVAEHLVDVAGSRALFATHYHELTALGEEHAHVANHSVSAREMEDEVVFLHRLVPGAAGRSYGVAVAKLAGLPESVLARSRAMLASLEAGPDGPPAKTKRKPAMGPATQQLDLFAESPPSAAEREALDTLKALDVERLTPLEALQLLDQLRGTLR